MGRKLADLRNQIRGMLKNEAPGGASTSRSFEAADETRNFKSHGRLEVLKFGDGREIGRAVFEPGWTWSGDVKPIAGTESCRAPHIGYCVKGKMEITMDHGERFVIQAGDAFNIAPGHNARVLGDEACELIDFSGYSDYAKPMELQKAA